MYGDPKARRAEAMEKARSYLAKNKNKLPKRVKKAWLAALRSGEYKQGTESLRSYVLLKEYDQGTPSEEVEVGHEEYCCLGVLGDVIIDGYWDGGVIYTEETEGGDDPFMYGDNPFLYGEEEICEVAKIRPFTFILAEMNDSGFSFADIADWIERNL